MAVYTSDVASELRKRMPDVITSDEKAFHMVRSVCDIIQDFVGSGESVILTGFGTFDAVKRAPKTYKDISTGKMMKSKAKRVPRFRAGVKFKDAVKPKAGRPKKIHK